MNSKESFIKTYEKEIKPLREEYYKSQIIKGLNKSILQKYIKIIFWNTIIVFGKSKDWTL